MYDAGMIPDAPEAGFLKFYFKEIYKHYFFKIYFMEKRFSRSFGVKLTFLRSFRG